MPTYDEIRDLIDAAIPDSTPEDSHEIVVKDINDLLHIILDKIEQVGIPAGGDADQILAKASDTDFDTEWTDGTVIEPDVLTASVYHSATDPFVDTSTDPTTGATLLRSVDITAGEDIAIQLNDFPFEYFIMEYDSSEPTITAFFDTVFHSGAIPDGFEWRAIFTVGDKKYLTSFGPAAFDAAPSTVSFTH